MGNSNAIIYSSLLLFGFGSLVTSGAFWQDDVGNKYSLLPPCATSESNQIKIMSNK